MNDNHGTLFIADKHSKRILTSKIVMLSYGAVFGPDVADVAAWREFAVDFVDNVLPKEFQ